MTLMARSPSLFEGLPGWQPAQPSRRSLAAAAACVLLDDRPDLTLVYLPHLDYDPQRFGPSGVDMATIVRELDDACGPLLEAAQAIGARVWVVSEYGHCDVRRPVYLNRALRQAIGIPSLACILAFGGGRRHRKQCQRRDAQILRLPGGIQHGHALAPGCGPGIVPDCRWPSQTNTGQMRSPALSAVSRIRRREKASRRRRRGRALG